MLRSCNILIFIVLFATSSLVFAGAVCPETKNEGQKFFQDLAARVVQSWEKSTVTYRGMTGETQLIQEFRDFKQKCASKMSLYGLASQTKNLEDFLEHRATTSQKGHDFGFLLNTQDYMAQFPKTNFELPEELKNGIPEDYEALAKRKGWKYFEYTASLVVGSDDSHRRLLFLIEESNGSKKWVQFTLPKTNKEPRGRGKMVDIIHVQKSEQGKSKISFVEYVWKNDSYQISPAMCLRCHANGPRPIRPAIGSIVKSNTTYQELNSLMFSHTNEYSLDGLMKESAMGPSMHSQHRCGTCHSAQQGLMTNFGNLHAGYDKAQIRHKVVDRLHMPPDLVNQWKYRHLKAVVSKVNSLSLSDRAAFVAGDPLNYEQAIDELLRLKKISAEDHAQAKAELKEAQAEARQIYDDVIQDYREKLLNWFITGERTPSSESKNPETKKSPDQKIIPDLFDF